MRRRRDSKLLLSRFQLMSNQTRKTNNIQLLKNSDSEDFIKKKPVRKLIIHQRLIFFFCQHQRYNQSLLLTFLLLFIIGIQLKVKQMQIYTLLNQKLPK